jgi:XTP/dITP diphosphohydrolase
MVDKVPLVFVTSNDGKVREVENILALRVHHVKIRIPEVQAIEIDEVIRFKAEQAYDYMNAPVLVEDTGLYIDAWNGLPGALIKWFLEAVGNIGLCNMLAGVKNRGAIAKCSFDIYDGQEHYLFTGITRGTIATAPSGSQGFGWDAIFIPTGEDCTFAEMMPAEKNATSMRRVALEKLRNFVHKL